MKLCSFFVLFFLSFFIQLDATITARDRSAIIRVSPSARFILETPIKNFQGTLEAEDLSVIDGIDITFDNGGLRNGKNKSRVDGALNSASFILDGANRVRGDGIKMSNQLIISGQGNIVEGDLLPSDDIILQDSEAQVTLAITRRLDKNIILNGGTIDLAEDLRFSHDKKIVGPGTISLNNELFYIGSRNSEWSTPLYFDHANSIVLEQELQLSNTWTFSGASTIHGNGNVLYLLDGAALVIEKGSTLLLNNIVINGLSQKNIKCLDNAASVTAHDVIFILNGNYQFDKGSLVVTGLCDLKGSYTFAYESSQTSSVAKNATLAFSSGITFSYDPQVGRRDLIFFEDSSSTFFLDGATLYATYTGMRLAGGHLLINKNVSFYAEMLTSETTGGFLLGGIELGANNQLQDMSCTILSGADLVVKNGDLLYRNVSSSALVMTHNTSSLTMDLGTRLLLDQTINVGSGILNLHVQSAFIRDVGVSVVGSIHFFS